MLNATYHALQTVFPGRRPFTVGRSTFAGSGTIGAHWGNAKSLPSYTILNIDQL